MSIRNRIAMYWRLYKGPTKMEMYGLTDIEYDSLEEFLMNSRIKGIVYNSYIESIQNERLQRRWSNSIKFYRAGFYRGWKERVRNDYL